MQQTVIPAQPQAYVASAGQPGVAYPPNTTVIIQTVPNTYQQAPLGYAKQQSQALGIIQIACGLGSIIFNIILIAIQSDCFSVAYIGYGIWGGVFYLISGGLGLGAAKNPSYCMMVSHMVMSIISACFTAIQLSFAGLEAGLSGDMDLCSGYHMRYNNSTTLGLSLTLVVIALAEAFAAIWASALCCSAMCCRNRAQYGSVPYGGQQQYATTAVANPGQVVYQQPHMQGQQLQMQGQQPQMQGQQPQMQPPQMQGQQQQYAYPQPQYVQNVAYAQPPVYTEK